MSVWPTNEHVVKNNRHVPFVIDRNRNLHSTEEATSWLASVSARETREQRLAQGPNTPGPYGKLCNKYLFCFLLPQDH